MKKSGFTLIELLGVIVILALLTILVFPSIINSVKSSSEKTDNLTYDLIYNATELFIENHKNDYPEVGENKYVIELQDLIDEDLLVSPIKLSDGVDITNKKCIQVTYNDDYSYEIKNTGECVEERKICTPASGSNLTGAQIGAKYKCDPGDGEQRTFYVLENGLYPVTGSTLTSDQVALIMNKDLGESTWGSETPTEAISYLESQTSSWTNVSVDLPSYYQINNVFNDETKVWLSLNLDNMGYWTSTYMEHREAYAISGAGNLTFDSVFVEKGIRPIIIIPKEELGNAN